MLPSPPCVRRGQSPMIPVPWCALVCPGVVFARDQLRVSLLSMLRGGWNWERGHEKVARRQDVRVVGCGLRVRSLQCYAGLPLVRRKALPVWVLQPRVRIEDNYLQREANGIWPDPVPGYRAVYYNVLQYINVYFLTGKPNIFCARPQPPSTSPRPLLSLSSRLSLVSNVLGCFCLRTLVPSF